MVDNIQGPVSGLAPIVLDWPDSGRYSPALSTQITTQDVEDIASCTNAKDDATRDLIHAATAALLVLRRSCDSEQLLETLRQLERCVTGTNAVLVHYLEHHQAHLHVIAVMKHLPSSLVVQQTGMSLLRHLTDRCPKLRESLGDSSLYSYVVQLLLEHNLDDRIQQCGLQILAILLQSDCFLQQLPFDGQHQRIAEVVCGAVTSFDTVPEIQTVACDAIARIIVTDTDIREYCFNKTETILINILKESSRIEIQIGVLDVFSVFAEDEKYRISLIQNDVHFTLMEIYSKAPTQETLIAATSKLLALFSKEDDVQKILASYGFVQSGLCPAVELLPLSEKVQRYGLEIIQSVVPRLFQDGQKSLDVAQVLVKIIYTAMFTHIEHSSIQIAGCKTLAVLLEIRPEAHRWIGDAYEDKQDSVHNMCLGAMLMFRKDSEVFTAACEAIYWIAADNERLCTSLMNKNVHIAIIEGLQRYRKLAAAVETGCRAMRGLCIFLMNHKKAVVRDGAFPVLADLQTRYQQEVHVQLELLTLITCLADVDIVRYQSFVEKIPQRIIDRMTYFRNEAMIQEAGLEAFAVFSATEGGADILIGCGALEKTLDALEIYKDNDLILKKGLIVLQLFASPHVMKKKAMRTRIGDIIRSVMNYFPNVKGIQTEVCVAVQVFAEADADMSRYFVDNRCHEYLFSVLEDADPGTGLQELASECLYVLSQEQNQKSVMLLSACKAGMLPATECLLDLGADVNIGEETNRPLYQATLYNHQNVVKLILKQEVSDLMTPLRLSLEQKTDVITGLILQQIGYDKDSSAIGWSNLSLRNLECSWVITALTNEQNQETDTDIGRYYIDTIKNVEQKRRHRKLTHSQSDISLRAKRVRLPPRRVSYVTEMKIEDLRPKSPSTSAVQSRPFSPFSSKRIVVRSTSLDSGTSPAYSKRPTLPTILSSSPATDLEEPVFDLSPTEEEEWRQTTLTGANMSYNSNDPRQMSPITDRRASSAEEGVWMRKPHRVPSPRLSGSSVSSLDDGSTSPYQGSRKMSAPALTVSGNTESPRQSRHSREGSVSDLEGSSENGTKRSVALLDVSENKIEAVEALASPELKMWFTRLEKLDLSGNRIKAIPDSLHKNLPCLRAVDIRHNHLEHLPETFLRCENLKELRVSHNKIQDVKMKHCNSCLKKLYLGYNLITRVQEGMGSYLPNLKELTLNNNAITDLPSTPLGLTELRTLDLSHNRIEALPDDFLVNSTNLDTLDMSFNILTRLPSESLSPRFQKLSKIKVRHNQLAERQPFCIPRFILELPSVRTVDISENMLTGLPMVAMWKSHMMKDFLASKNEISDFTMGKNTDAWSKLEKLHLAQNNLSRLPKEIGQLSNLCSLDISRNRNITTLPDELGRCSKLYEMPVDGLDKLDIDRALLQRRVKDIISYLHNRLKQAKRYYRMKLMVVGYGGRGKTTLLRTLMKETKVRENKATVGVVVKDWKYHRYERRVSDAGQPWYLVGSGKSKKVQCVLNTWDFAGQEEFYSTHNCYLSNRAVYLVVFDLNEGVADVDQLKSWLASIQSRAPGCPIIIVGTHLDKLPQDEVKCREKLNEISVKLREFNFQPGFPTISGERVFLVDGTSENEHVDRLRAAIKRTVEEFEIRGKLVMGEKIPASYVRLSELLTEKARSLENGIPVLKYSEVNKLVQDEQLDLNEDELQQAVRFLHESGVLLHYHDSSLQLRDLYFIDPGWLCSMMAQVITVKQVNPFISEDGILQKKDVHLLFKGISVFPESLIPQYIQLLEKFEIALPQSDTELLIPSCLPKDRPNIHLPVHSKNEMIRRIYRMPYVPIGLWFRLIARMISFTMQQSFRNILKLPKTHPRTICWKKGLYVFWSERAYFLLDSASDQTQQTESIIISVPANGDGVRLLGQIVDHMDNLVDEWYPGLTCIDPMKGQEILEVLAPCSQCPDHMEQYLFQITDLQSAAATTDTVFCPEHKADVFLTEIAPDLVLGDIEDEFKLDERKFEFKESAEYVLGDGGFGDVYQATYKKKAVAVKVFREIADMHPLKMLRQEATILRCLGHPSVVSLVAIAIRPPALLLEFAPHGTLGSLIKGNQDLKRTLQLRIAVQVAEGLAYLHKAMIVFRDMKPDNVLIFSTALTSPVNAKISDYGISRFASLQGMRAQEGTPSYRAPEVIRKENYSFQADIFSYGITMYVMLTGHHPFEHLESKGEMDRAIAEGLPIPPFAHKCSLVWPDMELMTMRCLNYSVEERPKAVHVWETLRRPETYCLQKAIPVSKCNTVECFAVEETSDRGLRLWIASGDCDTFQISFLSLKDPTMKTKGFLLKHGRIMCMQFVGGQHLALGSQLGRVVIFDTNTCTVCNESAQLQDSVLCMKYMKSEKEGGLLMVGLANGKLAIFTVQELLHEKNVDPVCLYPGHDYEPVLCMAKLGRRVFLTCGTQMVVLNTTKGINIDKIVETDRSRQPTSSPIYAMTVLKGQIIFSKKNISTVEIWDATKEKVLRSFKTENVLRISKMEARVTALLADDKALWVGTHSGHIGIVDVKTFTLLSITQRHLRAVRSLVHVKDPGMFPYNAVFSGGLGFRENVGGDARQPMCGCVLVWDAGFPHYAKSVTEYEKKRSELFHNYRRQPTLCEEDGNATDREIIYSRHDSAD